MCVCICVYVCIQSWLSQADWLSNAPQASMALYNPMVMSKLIWTRNAARLNPFNTDSFLWIDGGHLCNDPAGIPANKFPFFNTYFDKLLISYVTATWERGGGGGGGGWGGDGW